MDIWVCGFNKMVWKRCQIWWGLEVKVDWEGKIMSEKREKKFKKGNWSQVIHRKEIAPVRRDSGSWTWSFWRREDWEGIPSIPLNISGGCQSTGPDRNYWSVLTFWEYLIILYMVLTMHISNNNQTTLLFPHPLQDLEVGNLNLCSVQNRATGYWCNHPLRPGNSFPATSEQHKNPRVFWS